MRLIHGKILRIFLFLHKNWKFTVSLQCCIYILCMIDIHLLHRYFASFDSHQIKHNLFDLIAFHLIHFVYCILWILNVCVRVSFYRMCSQFPHEFSLLSSSSFSFFSICWSFRYTHNISLLLFVVFHGCCRLSV